jgi:hypothetical protein
LQVYADEFPALRPARNPDSVGLDGLEPGNSAGIANPLRQWNETARLLWHVADGQATIGGIASSIADTMEVQRETVERDATTFYLELWRQGRICFAPRVSRGAPCTPRAPEYPTLVVVLGLHSSGSDCLERVLDALGVHLDSDAGRANGSTPVALADICERAISPPLYRRTLAAGTVVREFSDTLDVMRITAPGGHIGATHAGIIALAPELEAAYPGPIRYVHIDRPLEHSIASLIRRELARMPDADPTPLRHHQTALWEMKQVLLASRPNLTLDYYDLAARPDANIRALADYLGLEPRANQILKATAQARLPRATADHPGPNAVRRRSSSRPARANR